MRWLEGVRILDLSRLLPGPFCTWLLAEMGAEVIKIEQPGGGDPVRWLPPQVGEMGAAFAALNRGKKSLALDLKSDQGREIFLRLVARADVVVESFRPGVSERLGIGYEELRSRRPALIYCAITGYGQDGPYRERAGHDIDYQAYTGSLGLTGPEEGRPVIPAVQVADLAGGAYPAAVAILGALWRREKTGEGVFIDVSMTEGTLALLAPLYAALAAGAPEPRRGRLPLSGAHPCYRVYRTRDGRFLALGALEPKFFERFCLALGRPDLAGSGLAEGEEAERVAAELESILMQQDLGEWIDWFESVDACVAPVLEPSEVLEDPQMRARRAFVELPCSGEMLQVPGSPFRQAGVPPVSAPPAPQLGEQSVEILEEIGLEPRQIEELQKQGIVG